MQQQSMQQQSMRQQSTGQRIGTTSDANAVTGGSGGRAAMPPRRVANSDAIAVHGHAARENALVRRNDSFVHFSDQRDSRQQQQQPSLGGTSVASGIEGDCSRGVAALPRPVTCNHAAAGHSTLSSLVSAQSRPAPGIDAASGNCSTRIAERASSSTAEETDALFGEGDCCIHYDKHCGPLYMLRCGHKLCAEGLQMQMSRGICPYRCCNGQIDQELLDHARVRECIPAEVQRRHLPGGRERPSLCQDPVVESLEQGAAPGRGFSTFETCVTEGCTKKGARVHNSLWQQQYQQTFDLGGDSAHLTCCDECDEERALLKLVFSNCRFKVVGREKFKGGRKHEFQIDERAGACSKMVDVSGNFIRLEVSVDRYPVESTPQC